VQGSAAETYVAYLVVTALFALMVTFSGIGKIRRDPRQVRVIHEIVEVPLEYFPLLAACEFAGAVGRWLGSGGLCSGSQPESASSSTSPAPSCHTCV
jgi:hypothetical protein